MKNHFVCKLPFSFLLLLLALATSVPGAQAQALLGGDYRAASLHDFVSHFDFKEKSKSPGPAGITEHRFVDDYNTFGLKLGTVDDNHIVYMKLVLPRLLIDNPLNTLDGRDLVKSFIAATMQNRADYLTLGALMDEVGVRGLDLHPVEVNTSTFADTGKPIPKNAYKIGSGPLQKNDRITFIDKMPVLTKTPSAMYSVFAGGADKPANLSCSSCQLEFTNGTENGASVLICEAWDQQFFQKNLASKQGAVENQSESAQSHLSQALELIATKDPVKSRLAEKQIEQAEALGSTDFRIPCLKAVASIQIGRQAKGLAALRDAVKAIPPGAGHESFAKEMTATADALQKQLAERAPGPVPAESRKYTIEPGTAAVIAERDEATGVVTMGFSGGHDPDGGKQDGTDDGIIQVRLENITQPTEVLRGN